MTVFDELLEANADFASRFQAGHLPAPPSRRLAVLTCMDARILPLQVFGLRPGDAHVIRNAGGRVSPDALRSLLVSTHVLGVRAVAVVHHSECGMARATDEELRRTVQEATGRQPEGIDFLTIDDPEEALRGDVESLRGSGLLPGGTEVHGFHYDVRTGRLRKVI